MTDDERELYLLHSRLPGHRKKIMQSQRIIADALKVMRNPYVSLSWGKDSEALVHLVIQQAPNILVLFVNSGYAYPETYELRDRLVSEWNLNYKEISSKNAEWYDYLKERGLCVELGPRPGIRNKVKHIEQATKENDGVFFGLRKDESNGRRINLLMRSSLYQTKDGKWHCAPLANWSARDVWAYIISNELPYNGVYDHCDDDFPRESLRNGSWITTVGANYSGRIFWLRRYYPRLYNEFVKHFPEIKSYS